MRAVTAELSREAQIEADRMENDARIREQVERDVPAHVTADDVAEERRAEWEEWAEERRAEWEEWAREKLGPEELYPEHFPESTHEHEEVE
jgi:hypothetical protein